MNFFDLHCDTPTECYQQNQEFYVNRLGVSGRGGEVFSKWIQTFAFFINDNCSDPYGRYLSLRRDFLKKIEKAPQNLTPVFSVEGGAVLEDSADKVTELHNDGIRFLTLTWNGENRIGGGCKTDKPLTDFGKRVIKEMNSVKMGCDLSHINEKGFYSAVTLAEFPLATHSNCRKICDHPRNLSDEQINLIIEKGGIIGLCFYPEFLGGDVFEKIYANVAHLLDLGLENHIAIGSDFDGAPMDLRLSRISQVGILFEELEKRGLPKSCINKIFYDNAYNFIAKLK